MTIRWPKLFQKSRVNLRGKVNITDVPLNWVIFPLGGRLGFVMENPTSEIKNGSQGQIAHSEWYVRKVITNKRYSDIEQRIDDELSGCWRCTGKENDLCRFCEHRQNADQIEKLKTL